MNAFKTLTLTEFKLFLREPAAVFFTIAFPLMLLFIFGSIFGNEPVPEFGNRGSVDVSVPGYVGMIIGTTAFMAIPVVIAEYRNQGIFRRLRATPVNPLAIIGAQMLIYYAMTLAGFLLLFIGGKLVYNLVAPEKPVLLIALATISFMSMAAFGFVVGSYFKTPRTANVVGNIVYFPQIFLGGATFPRELFGERVRQWTEWLPLTQVINLLKQAWFGDTISVTSVIYVIVIGIASAAISTKVFKWE